MKFFHRNFFNAGQEKFEITCGIKWRRGIKVFKQTKERSAEKSKNCGRPLIGL